MKIYVEDFALKHLLLFEICAREVREKFVYKHLEETKYVNFLSARGHWCPGTSILEF